MKQFTSFDLSIFIQKNNEDFNRKNFFKFKSRKKSIFLNCIFFFTPAACANSLKTRFFLLVLSSLLKLQSIFLSRFFFQWHDYKVTFSFPPAVTNPCIVFYSVHTKKERYHSTTIKWFFIIFFAAYTREKKRSLHTIIYVLNLNEIYLILDPDGWH